MKPVRFACALALGAFLIMASPSIAQDKGKGKGKRSEAAGSGVQIAVDIFIGPDREIIREYWADTSNLPPGLAKRNGDLPPGLEKQLRRKGQLPPGLQKRIQPFPVELERRLSPLKDGLTRGFIAGRAVIFSSKTSMVFDVFVVL